MDLIFAGKKYFFFDLWLDVNFWSAKFTPQNEISANKKTSYDALWLDCLLFFRFFMLCILWICEAGK